MSGAGDERHAVDQHVTQRPAADRKIRGRVERAQNGVDQRRIVVRIKPEGVADLVVEPAAGEVELDVPGFLLRARLVEQRARDEGGFDRVVTRAAGFASYFRGRGRVEPSPAITGAAPISACSAFSMRAVSLPPGTHRFSRSSLLANSASA